METKLLRLSYWNQMLVSSVHGYLVVVVSSVLELFEQWKRISLELCKSWLFLLFLNGFDIGNQAIRTSATVIELSSKKAQIGYLE